MNHEGLNLDEIEVSHTIDGVREGRVQGTPREVKRV